MARVSVLAKRLRQARLRAKLSQMQLGIKAGIDPSAASPRINQYERGKHVPAFEVVEQLAKVLRVPAPYFYARDDALAGWILAFDRVAATVRQGIVDKAGIDER